MCAVASVGGAGHLGSAKPNIAAPQFAAALSRVRDGHSAARLAQVCSEGTFAQRTFAHLLLVIAGGQMGDVLPFELRGQNPWHEEGAQGQEHMH